MNLFCTNCGTKLNPDTKFCNFCGKRIKEISDKSVSDSLNTNISNSTHCSMCGAVASVDNVFCTQCGNPIQTSGPQPSKAYASPKKARSNKMFNQTKDLAQKKKRRRRGIWIPITAVVTATALFLMLTLIPTKQTNDALLEYKNLQFDKPDKAVLIEKTILAKDYITPEGGTISSSDGKVTMTFDEFCIEQQVEAKIALLEVQNPPEDSIINAYDFTIDSKNEISGIVTIEVPYDPNQIPAGRSASECVSGVYYNEELHEWIEETYSIDESRNTVIIKTTHLSPHGARIAWNDEEKRLQGLFINLCEGTPFEYVIPLDSDNALGKLTQEEVVGVLEELEKIGLTNPQQAFNDAAFSMIGNTTSGTDVGVKIFKLTSYSGKWGQFLDKGLSNLSGALILAQLTSDVYYGTPQANTYFNLMKGLTFWKGPLLATSIAGPLAGAVTTVVLTGMFLLEFFWKPIEIPKYTNDSNHKVIVNAYHNYYHSGENYRTRKEWMYTIDSLVQKASTETSRAGNFDDTYKKLLDEEVTAYAKEFFNEKLSKFREYVGNSFDLKQGYLGNYSRVYSTTNKSRNKKYVEEYVDEILSAEYDGFTTSLEDELVDELKEKIYKDTIPAVMKMRKEYQYLKQLNYLRQAQTNMCQYFNTKFSLLMKDRGHEYGEKSEYTGYYIAPKIVARDAKYQLEKWITQINADGESRLNYTLIAHQMAGDFTQLNLYHKDDYEKILSGTAEPIQTLDIGTITSKEHKILFGEDSIDFSITAEKDLDYKDDDNLMVKYKFEAVSDYKEKCSIKWNFGDESEEVNTKGNKSKISHKYEKETKLEVSYTITAELLDKNDALLAKDTITITIDSEDFNLSGNWQGSFQITDDGGLIDYATKIAQQIGELIVKGIMRVLAPAFDVDMPSDEEISQAVTDSIEVNEGLFDPFDMHAKFTQIDDNTYDAYIVLITEEESHYETTAKIKNGKLSFPFVHEDGSKVTFTFSVYDNNTLSGEFESKFGFMKSLKGVAGLYR